MVHLSGGSFKNALLAPQLRKTSPPAYISYENHGVLFYSTLAAKAGIASTPLLLMLAETTAQVQVQKNLQAMHGAVSLGLSCSKPLPICCNEAQIDRAESKPLD